MAFMSGNRATAQDLEMERKVSLAARNLGDGVQMIVLAAKGQQQQQPPPPQPPSSDSSVSSTERPSPFAWKKQLLELLLGKDDGTSRQKSDVDVLLENSSCDKFVLRCVEHELPPNLIHCLRLLRVLELQHAAAAAAAAAAATSPTTPAKPTTSICQDATDKVQDLLCLLCTDPSVGEQLRPHLFGLLALSGASYPLTGIGVARAASRVIIAFSQNCLSTSLVWFLHDRKMVVHMTDDIKELCGITSSAASAAAANQNSSGNTLQSHLLYGSQAEEAGLWVIAVRTLVHLVVESCQHACLELLHDFDAAGGYHVLCHVLTHSSTEQNAKDLLDLIPVLACCRTDDTQPVVEKRKLATNPATFDIMEDIMIRYIPFLQQFEIKYGREQRPDVSTTESVRELANFSIQTAVLVRFGKSQQLATPGKVDLALELLVTTLQMYSDHVDNYAILEAEHNVLAFYILAFPTFTDDNIKGLILKTLEYVLTCVAGTNALQPLTVTTEVFFSICRHVLLQQNPQLADSHGENYSGEDAVDVDAAVIQRALLDNADLISGMFEKLMQFDDRVGPVLLRSGILDEKVRLFLDLLVAATRDDFSGWQDVASGVIYKEPLQSTPLDQVFCIFARVLKLLVGQQQQQDAIAPAITAVDQDLDFEVVQSLVSPLPVSSSSNLNALLVTTIKVLGKDASAAALGVYETRLLSQTKSAELLQSDMKSILELVDYLSGLTGRLLSIPAFATVKLLQRRPNAGCDDHEDNQKNVDFRKVYVTSVDRETAIFSMLKSVLEGNSLARDVFRSCSGFECIIRTFLCLEGVLSDEKCEGNEELHNALISMLENVLMLLIAAQGSKMRLQRVASVETIPAEVLADAVISNRSVSPATSNLHYLRESGFYMDFAAAISSVGLLRSPLYAVKVLDLAASFMDPSIASLSQLQGESGKTVGTARLLRNPDASRLVTGLVTYLPTTEEGVALATRAMDEVIQLTDPENKGTLSQLASCGLCATLTTQSEFTSILTDRSHCLHDRFALLLKRISAFSMDYIDFVSMLRCVAGPILRADSKDARIRLPVISNSVRQRTNQAHASHEATSSEPWHVKEADFCSRLETLCLIAERGDRVSRCEVGGDSINTIAVYMHKTRVEDRLYTTSQEGRLKFIEVECIDSSASTPHGLANAGAVATGSANAGDRIWAPLAGSGFTFSLWLRLPQPFVEGTTGNIYILDLSSPSASSSGVQSPIFLSVWYDVQNQRFNVVSSSSYRHEPTCFPVSPLRSEVWHHILVTFTPPKRSMIKQKAVLGIYIDGRPLEAEARVDSVNLPPNSRVHIGSPNPALASSGIVRGPLPHWEMGPTMMLSIILGDLDATAIYTHGPDFEGLFWGDRPQRLSLAATSTSIFAMIAESGEQGSVAGGLRRRSIARLETAGTAPRERAVVGAKEVDDDSLASVGLLCVVPPETVIFAFRASSVSWGRRPLSRRLVNVARVTGCNENASTDAFVYGKGAVVSPHCFADNIQWVGGPSILMAVVNATSSASSLLQILRLLRASVHRHIPNLEMMQAGGGYRILALILQEKRIMDESILDQCFAFAVHGFTPGQMSKRASAGSLASSLSWPRSDSWVFADLDAMKYLLLNHQVWDLRNSGPYIPLRLVAFFNALVGHESSHKAFNSRRLHLLGIVRWTLHLMLEAVELFTAGEYAHRRTPEDINRLDVALIRNDALSNGWYCEAPSVDVVSVGGDPYNPLLQACKTLLRRVLTFMLTPGDLEAIAEATIHTVSILGPVNKAVEQQGYAAGGPDGSIWEEKMLPSPIARVYLLRLLEELVVDGVNEIVASASRSESENQPDPSVQPHAGGGANTNQSYLSAMMSSRSDGDQHPRHQQAQAFLSAFAGVLSPVWFASLLEGCHEEASASAVLRLMILMLQSSPLFAASFEEAGGFAPLVLSIPKFSTCPGIVMSMLSQLLHAPILHLPCFRTLDASQLFEVFDAESAASEAITRDSLRTGHRASSDPSCGIFALLAECLGRNIQLAPFDNDLGRKARQTNEAVLRLLAHRHASSSAFQDFCRSPDFLEPLAQALCLVHDEKLQKSQRKEIEATDAAILQLPQDESKRMRRRGSLADAPMDITPTERFVGRPDEETGRTGIGMVELLRMVVRHAVASGPRAAPLINSLFHSFPIHASPEQVEAFHLVLIEHCKAVVQECSQNSEPICLANCIGVSSVFLDRLLFGFFTSEPALEAVSTCLSTLRCIQSVHTSGTIGAPEHAMLLADALHIARLTCITVLRRSRPFGPLDEGDKDLQTTVLNATSLNIQALLVSLTGSGTRKSGSSGTMHPPPIGSKLYPLWESASLSRCSATKTIYPDLVSIEEADRTFVVALLDEVHHLLLDPSEDLREHAVTIVVALLQLRRAALSELLIVEVSRGDRLDTIDIMNRGGFGALLVAHEAATIADSASTVPRRASNSGGTQSKKKKYASFFDWLDRNHAQVELVFAGIKNETSRIFPGLSTGAVTPEEAIENEQKVMLLKLTSQDASDRTILGGFERAELAQRCISKTADNHVLWKRQGFDDLVSGATQWKFLLRQLKGSCSIWEGGFRLAEDSESLRVHHLQCLVRKRDSVIDGSKAPAELVTRWKLDLTEGYEGQRRRLLPNYEFHSLYNLDEISDQDQALSSVEQNDAASMGSDSMNELRKSFAPVMEETAAWLKDLNIKRTNRDEDDDFFDDALDELVTEATTATDSSVADTESLATREDNSTDGVSSTRKLSDGTATQAISDKKVDEPDEGDEPGASEARDADNASSYDLITGILQADDWPEKSYNVRRCTGLEVRKALLLWCQDAIYIIDGFEQTEGEGLEGKITRLEQEQSSFNINLRPQNFKIAEDEGENQGNEAANLDGKGTKNTDRSRSVSSEFHDSSHGLNYQHRSQRIALSDLYSVFRRRYQLQQIALEFYDVHRSATFIAFSNNADREEILANVLSSPLPNSIFSSSYGTSINYKKFMSSWKSKIVSQWVNGKMSNFEFLMHLNSFAGRSYNDLTQYPVFPWVIADYESDDIDLENPKSFRDLSKPMGGLGAERARQFKERYEALEANYLNGGDEPPPFHYGTHYSCAAYVLYYLMRLEPYSRLALSLQGGRFDVADRLFHDVAASWRSASSENLQDVRELIPEFYYLQDFLENTNNFDFGSTQKGKTVHDVTLPKWAKGDPKRFVRINRQALESEYVSKNLHLWIDLVFGYKQRGREAVDALNTFVHVTYEGEVDLDAMTDPVQRDSTIAQIQNFGQTPSRLANKPFPQKAVFHALRDKNIDFGALAYLATLTPPFCVVGAPHRVYVRPTATDTCRLGMIGQSDLSVGDMCLLKGQLIGVGRNCALIVHSKKYCRFGGPNNGVTVHNAVATRNREANKILTVHDGMHRAAITAARASLNGRWLVTGCMDSTVRVWRYENNFMSLQATLCGHEGGQLTCLDISTVFGTIVTGCARGNVVLWDLRTLTFVRRLRHPFLDESRGRTGSANFSSAVSVSINNRNGNIVTLVGSNLSVFDINGSLYATYDHGANSVPTCAVSTDCPEWLEQGIVAVTGHENGEVRFWGIDYDNQELIMRHTMAENPHSCAITALRVTGVDRQDTLLVGDKSGSMTVCKTLQLENLNQQELATVVSELRGLGRVSDTFPNRGRSTSTG